MRSSRSFQRFAAAVASAALVVASLLAVDLPAAHADSQPVDAAEATTVSADPLPTVQIDGVAWSQVVVGTTVYVAGIVHHRPPGRGGGGGEHDAAVESAGV